MLSIAWEGPPPCFKYGGVGTYVLNFLRHASRYFSEVTHVCLAPSSEGVVVDEPIRYCGCEVVPIHVPKLTTSTDVSIASAAAIKYLLMRRGDYLGYSVITHDFHICVAGALLRGLGAYPHIHFLHSVSHAPPDHYCCESADALIVASDLMREEVIKWWGQHYSYLDPPPKLPPINVVPIPPPELPEPNEDPMKYRREVLREAGGSKYLLLYVGRVDPYKNTHSLLRIVKEVRRRGIDASLLVITPDHLSVRSKYVVIKERVSNEELVTAYRASDLLIHPAKHEPYGLTILEALTNDLLPITTRNVGSAQHLPIPKAGNEEELTNLIIKYLTNEEERKEILKKAKDVIKHLTWGKHLGIIKKIIELFTT